MELPVSSWNKTLEALGCWKEFRRRRAKRIRPRPSPLYLESLKARWTPSATTSMAWTDGTSVEGQYQAITLQLSKPALEPVIVTLAVQSESTADNADFWLSESTVTTEPGDTAATVIATYWNDTQQESTETVRAVKRNGRLAIKWLHYLSRLAAESNPLSIENDYGIQ